MVSRIKNPFPPRPARDLAHDAVGAVRGAAGRALPHADAGGTSRVVDVFPGTLNPPGAFVPPPPVPPVPPTIPSVNYSAAASPAAAKPIDPSYLVAGAAAAGLGAAALATQGSGQDSKNKKPTPSLVENVSDGVLSVTDAVSGVASTGATIVQLGMLPVMLGGFAAQLIGTPLAAGAKMAGWEAPSIGMNKLMGGIEKINGVTVEQFAGKLRIDPKVGQRASEIIGKTADFIAPVTNKISKIPGLGGLHADNIKASPQAIAKTSAMHAAFTGAFATSTATNLYTEARSFGSQMVGLRQLAAKLTNRKLDDVTTFDVLFGDMPKAVTEARNVLLATSGVHTITEAATLGILLKSAAIDRRLGMFGSMFAWEAPNLIRDAAEGFIGKSFLPMYQALNQAEEAGQAIPPQALAEFIMAANSSIRDRGRTGAAFAMELAQQYLMEGVKLAAIVDESSSGKMAERVKDIIARNKEQKQEASAELSHVERLNKPKQALLATEPKPAIGKFTQQVAQQAALAPTTPTVH